MYKDVDFILELATQPRFIKQKLYGYTRAVWPKAKPIEDVGIEISPPERKGNLPIIPCLHNAVMVGNPSHEARVYLVQWYRDLLTLDFEKQKKTKKQLLNEDKENVKIK